MSTSRFQNGQRDKITWYDKTVIDFVDAVRCEAVNILSELLPLAQDQCW